MAAHTRGKVAWDQNNTLGRHMGRATVQDRERQMKDVEYQRRQLQRELQALEDEYQRLGSEHEVNAWGPSDEEPRSLQVITQPPPPGSSSPGTNKRASWAGILDDKTTASKSLYGSGAGAVGTLPRSRTSMIEYKSTDPEDRFKVDIDVKEFNPEDVRIKLEDDGGVSVEAKREDKDAAGRFSTLERRSKVKLPHEVDRSRLSAIFSADDGVLTIQAPKRASGTSSPSSQGPQSPNYYSVPNSPPGQTIIVQPMSPTSPQNDIPFADEPPIFKPDYGSPYGRGKPDSGPQVIPYYIDREPPPRQTRSPSPTKRDTGRPSSHRGQPTSPVAYSPRVERSHNEPMYSPPRKSNQPRQPQRSSTPKTSTPEPNKIVLKPAIREDQTPRRGRAGTDTGPGSPRAHGGGSSLGPDKARSASLPRPRPAAQVQQDTLPSPEKADTLPPPMGRMTISFTLGRGFTPDQVIVKNIMNYNKFMVLAKADGYSGRKTFRHIFNWPCPINPATIYAYLKKDGVLHVSCMPLCGPE